MALLEPALSYQLIRITGVINLACLALIVLTCRCHMARFPALLKSGAFNALNRYHCAYWWALGLSVLLHILVASRVI